MALSSQPAIPIQPPPYLLSLATMEWLLEKGHVRLNPASPFGFLAVAARHSTPEEQEASARRELGRRPPSSLLTALAIVARPDARIRVTTQVSNESPRQTTLWRHGSSVAEAGFNTEGFLFGAPTALATLESLLIEQVRSEAPDQRVTERVFAPTALGLLTPLWPHVACDIGARVPVADVLSTCQRIGADADTAQTLVSGLVESGLVVKNDAALSLAEGLAPWLAALWSGERFEVEVTPLPDGDLDAAHLLRRSKRLLFVGPTGQRIVSRAIDATSLDEIPLGVPLRTDRPEPLVALSYLDDKSLARVLGPLLTFYETEPRDNVSTALAAADLPV